MAAKIDLVHVYVDHSNMWGGARAASKKLHPKVPDELARLNIAAFDVAIGGKRKGVSTKVVAGGIPPGMEGVWQGYEKAGYDTNRLMRNKSWQEIGVDHTLIGHMWRLVAKHQASPTVLVLASGDGKSNEFGTSYKEVVAEVLQHERYKTWRVELATWYWPGTAGGVLSTTNGKLYDLVANSPRGKIVNLFEKFSSIVYHEKS